MHKESRRTFPAIVVFIIVAISGVAAGAWWKRHHTGALVNPAMLASPNTIEPFSLIDHDNRTFDLARLKGKWTFLFFGYTHCPDVCPFTLSEMDRVYRRLSKSPGVLDDTRFVFVSVDPKRDTPAELATYVTYFNETFTGATGSKERIDNLTRQLGVSYNFAPGMTPEEYVVNHSASIFLIGPKARVLGVFKPPHDAATITGQFLDIRKRLGPA